MAVWLLHQLMKTVTSLEEKSCLFNNNNNNNKNYNPINDQMISEPPMPSPRHDLVAAAVNNQIYVIGSGLEPAIVLCN
jgi:hypothetical protein